MWGHKGGIGRINHGTANLFDLATLQIWDATAFGNPWSAYRLHNVKKVNGRNGGRQDDFWEIALLSL